MKVWELIEQLQGRDPSGEVVLTLSGDGFKYVAAFDLTPPANRKCVIEADPEDIGVNTVALGRTIEHLGNMVDDLQSALQQVIRAHTEHERSGSLEALVSLRAAVADAKEISGRERP